jgi:hypothetical protein
MVFRLEAPPHRPLAQLPVNNDGSPHRVQLCALRSISGRYTDSVSPARGEIDLAIRPIVQHDYDRWVPLWHGYNAFYGRSGPTALAPEITRTTLGPLLRR